MFSGQEEHVYRELACFLKSVRDIRQIVACWDRKSWMKNVKNNLNVHLKKKVQVYQPLQHRRDIL